MHCNYNLDDLAITNIIERPFNHLSRGRRTNKTFYYTKFKTSNLIKNNTNSTKIHPNQTNVVYEFIYLLPKKKFLHWLYNHNVISSSESSAMKHLIVKRNNRTNQIT